MVPIALMAHYDAVASSEQVRPTNFRDAVNHWRHYEPWLDPLKAAPGLALDTYPRAPPLP